MQKFLLLLVFLILSSCSTNYTGTHENYNKFVEDVTVCLSQLCVEENTSLFEKFMPVSTLLAYGGGGGGGGGGGSSSLNINSNKNKISLKKFNICMNEKGYTKSDKGIFELPALSCN